MVEGTEGADFLAFLALGSIGDFSVGPCVGGCLGNSFLLAMDFLRANRVGSEGGSAGAALFSGVPYSAGVISGSLREDFSGEETISSISGGDYLEDPLYLRSFWVI